MALPLMPNSLDHVALWTDERDALAAFLCDHLGMHEIERTDAFTLVGVDAKLGKLTLFDADGPRDPGALERVVLRVGDLEAAVAALPVPVERENGAALFDAPGGLRMGLVEAPGTEYDLDHVVISVPDTDSAAERLTEMGFDRSDGSLTVDDRAVRLEQGAADDGGRPLLNHIALLVDSARGLETEAERHGFEVDDVKDAANTFAVFLKGPAGLRVEYVEHKPGFALV
ncbi:MAG TPA: VOC family protein [Thermoleophilaceae bacterium]|jgi:catechol 2,3-dioxygenase-like lactoylglutathione lyase family enzyme